MRQIFSLLTIASFISIFVNSAECQVDATSVVTDITIAAQRSSRASIKMDATGIENCPFVTINLRTANKVNRFGPFATGGKNNLTATLTGRTSKSRTVRPASAVLGIICSSDSRGRRDIKRSQNNGVVSTACENGNLVTTTYFLSKRQVKFS